MFAKLDIFLKNDHVSSNTEKTISKTTKNSTYVEDSSIDTAADAFDDVNILPRCTSATTTCSPPRCATTHPPSATRFQPHCATTHQVNIMPRCTSATTT